MFFFFFLKHRKASCFCACVWLGRRPDGGGSSHSTLGFILRAVEVVSINLSCNKVFLHFAFTSDSCKQIGSSIVSRAPVSGRNDGHGALACTCTSLKL